MASSASSRPPASAMSAGGAFGQPPAVRTQSSVSHLDACASTKCNPFQPMITLVVQTFPPPTADASPGTLAPTTLAPTESATVSAATAAAMYLLMTSSSVARNRAIAVSLGPKSAKINPRNLGTLTAARRRDDPGPNIARDRAPGRGSGGGP